MASPLHPQTRRFARTMCASPPLPGLEPPVQPAPARPDCGTEFHQAASSTPPKRMSRKQGARLTGLRVEQNLTAARLRAELTEFPAHSRSERCSHFEVHAVLATVSKCFRRCLHFSKPDRDHYRVQ